MKIIFAQGNPEPDYTGTRHNVGFSILNTLADQLGAKWNAQSKFRAFVADVSVSGQKILLVKPTTFYNETGYSARQIVDFYKINQPDELLVIHDDLSLPFGTIRVRDRGSDAGNNGLKSLNAHLGQDFKRIRVGIYHDPNNLMNDADFVLSKFTTDESKKLSNTVIPQTIELINEFINDAIQPTSQTVL